MAYVLPRHPGEANRLDLQHHVLRAVLGSNYLAPIERPARLLEVGSGTGQWAFELAAEFPDALVVGFDLVPSKGSGPANYRFVRGNVLQGLPFGDGQFDFVHQRLMVSGVPVSRWAAVAGDLVRVTRPEGWIELVEAMPGMEPEGPATARLLSLLRQLVRTTGLDSLGHVMGSLDRYLEQAGAVAVQTRTLTLPIGEWGGNVGSWLASDARALFTRLEGTFEARLGLAGTECRQLIATMLDEFEQYRPTTSFKIALGQRPTIASPH
jgi:ubiquinone/menaquinone biosynthesis C-methylase UbiE